TIPSAPFRLGVRIDPQPTRAVDVSHIGDPALDVRLDDVLRHQESRRDDGIVVEPDLLRLFEQLTALLEVGRAVGFGEQRVEARVLIVTIVVAAARLQKIEEGSGIVEVSDPRSRRNVELPGLKLLVENL